MFLIILTVFSLCNQGLVAQRKADIGIFTGTSYYMGDLNPSKHFYSPGFAIGPVYRYNFHKRSSVRVTGIYHTLSANDLDFEDPFQQNRGNAFNASFVDLSAMYEFNFTPYKTAHRRSKPTLFIAAGLGYQFVVNTNVETNSHFTIPYTMGVKFNAGKKLSAGVEWSMRKTFTDMIDGTKNLVYNEQKSLPGNKDWYNFAGIFVTYKIFRYREDCPAYD